jgi:transposase
MRKYTIKQFEKDFPNDDACLELLKNHLYPDGIKCEKCGRVTPHHRITKRRCYSCDYCGTHTYPTANTVFHKSSTSLRLWFYAVYLMSSTRCGISAKYLERELGVTYKTAWRMFHQIRKLLKEDIGTLSGEVEMDETYVGGKRQSKRGRGAEGKTIVAGAVERKGKVKAQIVQNIKAETLLPILKEYVLPSSMIYTDELPSYSKVSKSGYNHERVHHAVYAKYLQRYLDEFMFRYNHSKDEEHIFTTWLTRVCQGIDQIGHPLYGGKPSLSQI